jgi:hypothetical protein
MPAENCGLAVDSPKLTADPEGCTDWSEHHFYAFYQFGFASASFFSDIQIGLVIYVRKL